MTCPRCSVSEISPLSGSCELCGFTPGVNVAVEHPDPTDELVRGELAHEFVFEAVLGRGHGSSVYLMRELQSINHHVVLKVYPRKQALPVADERFRTTLSALIGLDHPHIAQLLRYGATDSLFWYSTEHVRSRTLREILRAGPLPQRTCLRLATQIAGGLEHAHRHGLVHGALKPENVLVDEAGWVRLTDLLVTRALSPRRAPRQIESPPTGKRPSGSHQAPPDLAPRATRPVWIAPEDFQDNQCAPAADQYALAAIVYECLTGRPPADPPRLLTAVLADAPPHLSQAVARALSPVPAARFPTAMDFVAAMESPALASVDAPTASIRNSPARVSLVPDWTPPDEDRQLRPLLIGATIVTLLVLGFVFRSTIGEGFRRLTGSDWQYNPAASAPAAAPAPEPAAPAGSTVTTAAPPTRPSLPPSRRSARSEAQRRRDEADAPPASAPVDAAPAPAPTAPPAAAQEGGRLFVNASPWGQVYVDGQLIGNTPRANVPLSAGSHTIRVSREGFVPFERTIRIEPGAVVRITDITLTPSP